MPGTTPTLGLPYPVPDDSVDVPRDIKALADAMDPLGIVPVGTILMWPAGAAPTLWLLCNGTLVPAANYPRLAAVLGSSGGNVTLPNLQGRLPLGVAADRPLASQGGAAQVALQAAQMPVHAHAVSDPGHAHSMTTVGQHSHGGATVGADRGLGHQHDYYVTNGSANRVASNAWGGTAPEPWAWGNHQHYGGGAWTGAQGAPDHLHGIYADGNHAHGIYAAATGVGVGSAGGGTAHENMPPYYVVNFIIRAG